MQPPYKLRNYKWFSVNGLTLIRVFNGPVKALIRLHMCAGWSEALLVAHTRLLEISCHGLYASSHSLNKHAQLHNGATSHFACPFIIFHVVFAGSDDSDKPAHVGVINAHICNKYPNLMYWLVHLWPQQAVYITLSMYIYMTAQCLIYIHSEWRQDKWKFSKCARLGLCGKSALKSWIEVYIWELSPVRRPTSFSHSEGRRNKHY